MASKTGNLKQDSSRAKVDAKKVRETRTYGAAKKNDPRLDEYVKARNNAAKGSVAYNEAQNKINRAYGSSTRAATAPAAKTIAKKTAAPVKSSSPKPTLQVRKPVASSPAPVPAKAVKKRGGSKTVAQGADRADRRAERKGARVQKRTDRQTKKINRIKGRMG